MFEPQSLCAADSSESGSHKTSHREGGGRGSGKAPGDGKPTRVRTVLNEKQLHTLRTCYSANPRPDALMKEQLVEMTQLSPRVIRVWFQNKRCKDKKRAIALKQQQQQEKVTLRIPPGYGRLFFAGIQDSDKTTQLRRETRSYVVLSESRRFSV